MKGGRKRNEEPAADPVRRSNPTASLLASFAAGIAKSKAAVHAAITQPWSKGQTEGQVNKLKMVKRQMYGRAKVDLPEARLIGAE